MPKDNEIQFTPEKLRKLKKLYKAHEGSPKDSFLFEDQEINVGYAKYLIEYLEQVFGGKGGTRGGK